MKLTATASTTIFYKKTKSSLIHLESINYLPRSLEVNPAPPPPRPPVKHWFLL